MPPPHDAGLPRVVKEPLQGGRLVQETSTAPMVRDWAHASTWIAALAVTPSRPSVDRVHSSIRKLKSHTRTRANNLDILPFIRSNGPVREVRFKTNPDGTPDGGVHDLFTITGRPDAELPQHCPAGLRNELEQQRHFPHPDAVVWRRPDRRHSRSDNPRQQELATPRQQSPSRHLGSRKSRRQRRHDHPLRLEGAKQVAPDLRGRSLQRRAGRHEPDLPGRARRNTGCVSSTRFPGITALRGDGRRNLYPDDTTAFASSTPAPGPPFQPTRPPRLRPRHQWTGRRSSTRSGMPLVPHPAMAETGKGVSTSAALTTKDRQPVLRPVGPRHGYGPGGRRFARWRKRPGISHGAAVGRRSAHFLPARWSDNRPPEGN